jgi:hypothetical protein
MIEDGIRIFYYCKPCKRERQKLWVKAQWFADYSIRCSCGRRLWSKSTPDFKRKREDEEAVRRWNL